MGMNGKKHLGYSQALLACVAAPALGVVAASPSFAQSFLSSDYAIPQLPDQPYEASVSQGPVSSAVTLAFEGKTGAGFQSNIFKDANGAEVSDFVFSASPRAVLRVNTGGVKGKIEAGADLTKYSSNPINDQVDLFVRGKAEFGLSDRSSIFVDAGLKQDEHAIEANLSQPGLTPTETRTSLEGHVEAGFKYAGDQWTSRAAVGLSFVNYDGIQATGDPLAAAAVYGGLPGIDNELRNKTTVYASAEAGKKLSLEGEIFGGVKLEVASFQKDVSYNPARNSTTIEPFVGYRHTAADGSLEADARIGVAIRSFDNDDYDTIIVPTVNASATWSPDGRDYAIFASTETTLDDTLAVGVGAKVTQEFKVGARANLNDRWEINGDIGGEYALETVSEALGGGSDSETTLGVGVGMKYFVMDNIYVGADARYETTFGNSAGQISDAVFRVNVGAEY